MRSLALLVLVTVGIAGRAVAVAAPPPPPRDDCPARIAWIQARLEHTAHKTRVWQWGWGLGAVGATAIQLGLVPLVDDKDTRIDLAVGAGSTLAILVPVLTAPQIDERLLPEAAGCPAQLADAERRLAAAADAERSARSPWLHAGNFAFNLGVGLLLGLGFDHWTSGITSAAAGFAVGELQILSAPDDAEDDLAAVRAVALAPLVVPSGGGLALVVRF